MACGSSLARLFGNNKPKMFCQEHNGEELKRYCKSDDEFVCLECILENHKGHNIVKLTELASSKREEIICLVNQVKKNYLVELRTRINDSKEAKRIHKQCVSDCTRVMKTRAAEISKQLNRLKNDTISELKEVQKYEIERQDEIENFLLNEEKSLSALTKSIEKAIKNNNDEEIIHLSIALENALLQLQQTPPANVEAMEFYAYEEVQDQIEEIFGFCKVRELYVELSDDEENGTIVNVEQQVDVQEAYKLSDDPVTCLTPTKRGSVWIGFTGQKTITQTLKGETMKSEDLDTVVIDIGISKESDLIVALKRRHSLLRIRPNGQKIDFIDVKPLYPNGLYVTDDGFTFISVIDNESTDTSSDNERAVMKFSNTGTGIQKISKDDKGVFFFILPHKLVVTPSKDVCVIDSTSLYTGRIVTVTNSGSLKYTYNGREDLEMQTFNPTDIICDSHERIFVADFDNCLLHLLNADGELVSLLNSNAPEGIYGPCSLGIDHADQIWIGSYDGYVIRIAALNPPRKKGKVDKPLPKLIKDGTSLSIKQTTETLRNPSVGKTLRSKSAIKPGNTNKLEKQDSKKLDTERAKSAYTFKRENSLMKTKNARSLRPEPVVNGDLKNDSKESGKTNIVRKEANQLDPKVKQNEAGTGTIQNTTGNSKDTKNDDNKSSPVEKGKESKSKTLDEKSKDKDTNTSKEKAESENVDSVANNKGRVEENITKSKDISNQVNPVATTNITFNPEKKPLEVIAESKTTEKEKDIKKAEKKSKRQNVDDNSYTKADTKETSHGTNTNNVNKSVKQKTSSLTDMAEKNSRPEEHEMLKPTGKQTETKTKSKEKDSDEISQQVKENDNEEASRKEKIKKKEKDIEKEKALSNQQVKENGDGKPTDSNTILQKPTLVKRKNDTNESLTKGTTSTNNIEKRELKLKTASIKQVTKETKGSSRGVGKEETKRDRQRENKNETNSKPSPFASTDDNLNRKSSVSKERIDTKRNSISSNSSLKLVKKSNEKVEELQKIYDKPNSAKTKETEKGRIAEKSKKKDLEEEESKKVNKATEKRKEQNVESKMREQKQEVESNENKKEQKDQPKENEQKSDPKEMEQKVESKEKEEEQFVDTKESKNEQVVELDMKKKENKVKTKVNKDESSVGSKMKDKIKKNITKLKQSSTEDDKSRTETRNIKPDLKDKKWIKY